MDGHLMISIELAMAKELQCVLLKQTKERLQEGTHKLVGNQQDTAKRIQALMYSQ